MQAKTSKNWGEWTKERKNYPALNIACIIEYSKGFLTGKYSLGQLSPKKSVGVVWVPNNLLGQLSPTDGGPVFLYDFLE